MLTVLYRPSIAPVCITNAGYVIRMVSGQLPKTFPRVLDSNGDQTKRYTYTLNDFKGNRYTQEK